MLAHMPEYTLRNLEKQYTSETRVPCTDSLTGLYHHGFFQLGLEQEIERHRREAASFSLALVDIDHFSEYNRDKGIFQGDRLLQDMASILRDNLQGGGFAARLHNDLFAVLHPQAAVQDTVSLLEKINKDIQAFSANELSISAGLSSYPEQATSREELFHAANEQLRRAKSSIDTIAYAQKKYPEPHSQTPPRVLIVDDEERNVKLLEALLLPLGYKTFKATSGAEALKTVYRTDIDLILLDIMMPGINGYEVCRTLKSRDDTRMIPIIMITALDDIEAKIRGIETGADDFLTKPPSKVELLARTRSLLKTKRLNEKLTGIETVLSSLANVVEAKDVYTQGHVHRVAQLAQELGIKLNRSADEIESLKIGGILHDIGKIAVPKSILNKPGPLTGEESDLMKTHSRVGHKICLPLKKNLGLALKIIRHHHEKLDGSGYPDGLKGQEIPVVVRIMAVVDIYDAMITDRPYRKAISIKKALQQLRNEVERGTLDEKVVEELGHMVEPLVSEEMQQ